MLFVSSSRILSCLIVITLDYYDQRRASVKETFYRHIYFFSAQRYLAIFSEDTDAGSTSEYGYSNSTPKISHLLFTDDTLIFYEANFDVVRTIKYLLEKYEQASGQQVNLEKSGVLFSLSVWEEFQ
ncbi:UNVERIFIED_CONTAM: hypothetical protein Sindi_1377100 [Sesamum indicum]